MNPPEFDTIPTKFGPFIRHLSKPPTLQNVLEVMCPSTIDETMAIAEGYILMNDYRSARCILMQLRTDIECISYRSPTYEIGPTCSQMLELLDNNIACIDDILDRQMNYAYQYSGTRTNLGHLLDPKFLKSLDEENNKSNTKANNIVTNIPQPLNQKQNEDNCIY